MRNLKYAILGLLNQQMMTGYDIAKEFDQAMANFWSADHSQIYPELKRLLKEELITYKVIITGEVMEKKLYTITKKGRDEFLRWLEMDEAIEPTPKDKFRLRMYFSNELSRDEMIFLLESQRIQRIEKRNQLSHALQDCENLPHGDKQFGDSILIEGAILREEAYIKWLENCIQRCQTQL